MDEKYDVVIVGGGAAGLAGAVTLARSRRSVLVIDAGDPRNAPAGHVHNYLGRESTPPLELLAIGRDEVTGYGGEVVSGTVTSAKSLAAEGFRVTLADGREFASRRLLVTTGLIDELPDVPGVRELWGSEVLHCPYCHGWEARDSAVGILATSSPLAAHAASLWRQLTEDVVVFQHVAADFDDDTLAQFEARGIRVVPGKVTELAIDDGHLTGARLESGEVVARDVMTVAPMFVARSAVLESLGLEAVEMRMGEHVVAKHIPADPAGATEVPGVWVAGNVTNPMAQVILAAGGGMSAGAAINGDLAQEDTRRAVELRAAAGAK